MRVVIGLALAAMLGADASAQVLNPKQLKVDGQFLGKKDKLTADLSALACDDKGAKRRCLFVSDEASLAQFGEFSGDTINVIKKDLRRLDGKDAPKAVGDTPAPRKDDCPNEADAEERDLEGATLSGGSYYIVGSHGCSRGKGGKQSMWRQTQFLLFRLDRDGKKAEATWNLAGVLRDRSGPQVGAAFGQPLAKDGLTIEGLAVHKDKVYVGLRAPAKAGTAYVVRASEAKLFGAAAYNEDAKTFGLPLGVDVGVRDLAWLDPGKQLLVLTGPSVAEVGQYDVRLFDIDQCEVGTMARLPSLEPDPPAKPKKGEKPADPIPPKPEGLFVVESKGDRLTILVTHDTASNGRPYLYEISSTRPTRMQDVTGCTKQAS